LLGFLVERITGTDFRIYCRENIFNPLGMTNTSFGQNVNSGEINALPYPYGGSYSVPYYPASSLKTSISDFSKFLMVFINSGAYKGARILKSQSVAMMLTIQNPGSTYGLIWKKQGRGFGHAGAFHGVTSFVDLNPNSGSGFIIFINKTQWLLPDPDIAYPGGELYTVISQHYLKIISRDR
jgi:CubicO group peptidase (beta-lactamase class C family)